MSTEKIERIDRSLRWLWLGPVAGMACLVPLFGYGAVSGSAQLMVISAITAGMLGVIWASTYAGLRSQRSKLAR